MNMPVKIEYLKNPKNRELTQTQLDELASELDAIKQEELDDLGEKDAKYIRRVYSTVRYSSMAGRALLFAGWFPPAWILGTGLLSFSKIMENMELGHNVMHGQYDWMNDPKFNGQTYEWDIVGTSDNWRQTHNFKHHTYTNIKGMDDDIGYGLLRLFQSSVGKRVIYCNLFTVFRSVYCSNGAWLFKTLNWVDTLEVVKAKSRPKKNGNLCRQKLASSCLKIMFSFH